MKGSIVTAIIVVVVLTLVVAWAVGTFELPYWETKASFGSWQEEIMVEFDDGTIRSLILGFY